jgi:hypothetical protein
MLIEEIQVLTEGSAQELGLHDMKRVSDLNEQRHKERTICGMMVTLDRRASKLIPLVGIPS